MSWVKVHRSWTPHEATLQVCFAPLPTQNGSEQKANICLCYIRVPKTQEKPKVHKTIGAAHTAARGISPSSPGAATGWLPFLLEADQWPVWWPFSSGRCQDLSRVSFLLKTLHHTNFVNFTTLHLLYAFPILSDTKFMILKSLDFLFLVRSCSFIVSQSIPLSPFTLSIYLAFLSSVFLSLFISLFLLLSLCSTLFSPPSFFLSASFSPSLAVINRCLVGCWSVRNGRSDGFSQLLQAFLGSPHRSALCAPGSQTCRQNIQNMNRVFKYLNCFDVSFFHLANYSNKWTHLMQK